MSANNFYLTTTLPYVNAEPHIGFALEIVAADVIARYQRLENKAVIFNTGTDEHGQKIYTNAMENQETPQAYCDRFAAKFSDLKSLLNLSYTHFIRTTDQHHQAAAQEFWLRCAQNGDIYQQEYQTKYCVGCELEKTDSELVDGQCPLHPTKKIEERSELNYFFRFSHYQQSLLNYYEQHPDFVQPASKMAEIVAFVKAGIKDFSISRVKDKMPWGIEVPGDPTQVMYVWFDALVNYVSTLGWPDENSEFNNFWPVVQLAGKDNLRQQAAMWQAMLMSAQIQPSRKILINGFISVAGQKMSKSLGNVISPVDMVQKYGPDATRVLLLNLGAFGEDMDVTWERFDTEFTAFLVNGLGNLVSRVAALSAKINLSGADFSPMLKFSDEFKTAMDRFDLTGSLKWINHQITELDGQLSQTKPWTLSPEESRPILIQIGQQLITLAYHLQPFAPATAEKILAGLAAAKIEKFSPLFPRLT